MFAHDIESSYISKNRIKCAGKQTKNEIASPGFRIKEITVLQIFL